jgi:hypothetical protein
MRMMVRRFIRLGIGIVIIGLALAPPKPGLAAVSCPPKSAAIPVVSWLINQLDSVTIHRFSVLNGRQVEVRGYPKTSTDPAFLEGVLNLTGAYVQWNGYNSPSPFGAFYYPRWGDWFAQYELRTGQDVYFVWMWRSTRYNRARLLVFTFADLQSSTDSQGQHEGQHHFCMTAVPVWVIERLEQALV